MVSPPDQRSVSFPRQSAARFRYVGVSGDGWVMQTTMAGVLCSCCQLLLLAPASLRRGLQAGNLWTGRGLATQVCGVDRISATQTVYGRRLSVGAQALKQQAELLLIVPLGSVRCSRLQNFAAVRDGCELLTVT